MNSICLSSVVKTRIGIYFSSYYFKKTGCFFFKSIYFKNCPRCLISLVDPYNKWLPKCSKNEMVSHGDSYLWDYKTISNPHWILDFPMQWILSLVGVTSHSLHILSISLICSSHYTPWLHKIRIVCASTDMSFIG